MSYTTIGAYNIPGYGTFSDVIYPDTPNRVTTFDPLDELGRALLPCVQMLTQETGYTGHKYQNGTTGTTDADGSRVGIASDGTLEIRQKEALNVKIFTQNLERIVIGNTTVSEYATIRRVSSATLANAAEITLASGVAGFLHVWNNVEALFVYVNASGVVTLIFGTTNTAITDAANKLCIYQSGTGCRIKNNLGSSTFLRYQYQYS